MKPVVFILLGMLLALLVIDRLAAASREQVLSYNPRYTQEQVRKANPAFVYFHACGRTEDLATRWIGHDYAYRKMMIVGVAEAEDDQSPRQDCVFVYTLKGRQFVHGTFLEVLERLK